MAITKNVPTPIGIDFKYHRIRTIMAYYKEQCADVFVTSYVSEDHRRSDAEGLDSEHRLTFTELGIGVSGEVTRPVAYNALKLTETFSGAGDA